jgi:hypothetical protein
VSSSGRIVHDHPQTFGISNIAIMRALRSALRQPAAQASRMEQHRQALDCCN